MKTFTRCLETIWKDNQPSKRPNNAFKLLTLKILNTSKTRFEDLKTSVFKRSSSRYQVMRPEDALHGVFETFGNAAFKTSSWHLQMAQVKMCYRHSENVFKIEIKTSSKRLYLNFKSKTWSRLQCVFKVFQPNAPKTSLWRLQIIHVLKTSSTSGTPLQKCRSPADVLKTSPRARWAQRTISKSTQRCLCQRYARFCSISPLAYIQARAPLVFVYTCLRRMSIGMCGTLYRPNPAIGVWNQLNKTEAIINPTP